MANKVQKTKIKLDKAEERLSKAQEKIPKKRQKSKLVHKEAPKSKLGKCPRCGSDVVETKKAYSCKTSDCGFALWKDNKFFTAKKKALTEKVAVELLQSGKVKLTGCYSEKTGKTYNCTVLLDDSGGKYVGFKMEFGK